MHRAVDIKNLQRLPGPHARVLGAALAACKDDPSLDDLRPVASLLEKAPAWQKILYLPVIHIVLDPARIPTADDMETLQPDTTARITCASLSLMLLFCLSITQSSQPGLGSTLWPRVWPWIYFMHEHLKYLPGPIAMPEMMLYFHFLAFVDENFDPLCDYPPVTSTPGFRFFVGKAWAALSRMKLWPDHFDLCVKAIAMTLVQVDFTEPVHFMEMADGAGGGLEDLARLSAEFLDPDGTGELSPLCLNSLVVLILESDDEEPDLDPSLREKFLEALRQHNFLPSLLAGMEAYVETDSADSESMELWFDLSFTRVSSARWRAPRFDSLGELDERIRYLLTILLPEGMAYYHVVAAIDEALDSLTEVFYRKEFEALAIFDDWNEFLELAETRVELKRELGWAETLKACDNVECGELEDRSQYRRCSGCKTLYYCSQECQIVDWQRGGHRKRCGSNTMLSLAESQNCTLGFRERQFMRALVQDDYRQDVDFIYQQQVELLAADPDALLLTLFDYTYVPVQITVHSVADSPITDTLNKMGAEWADLVSRAERSRGRMQLHIIKVPDGIDTRLWAIPLRTSSSQVYDAVHDLALDLPAD
ncbi:MYND-type domain-containing protein [Mycena sanguinolenta]|uniref:MYND-type domain-containing protein n=1 Tax=Mycena sanguinolenta TaxID=230812 RepID=A0A8H6WNX8_9AGAR|nr:MYND-type domain-containing protein [Mycena sanguinolenta]